VDDASNGVAAIRRLRRSPPSAAAITWALMALGGAAICRRTCEAEVPRQHHGPSRLHVGWGGGSSRIVTTYVGIAHTCIEAILEDRRFKAMSVQVSDGISINVLNPLLGS
jgi:hypothetical protein